MAASTGTDDRFLACAECFSNEGLRFTAHQLGSITREPCPRCGSVKAPKLTTDALTELFETFFCEGSRRSIYDFELFCLRPAGSHPSPPADFEHNTMKDYWLLIELTGLFLTHYAGRHATIHYRSMIDEIRHRLAPPSAMVSQGMVHYDKRSADETFDELLAPVPRTVLSSGTRIYRARKEPKHPLSEAEFDSPPSSLLRPARFNTDTMRTFYGALDVQTCLAELRLTPEEVAHNAVVLATFEVTTPLNVLDLTHKDIHSNEEVWNTLFLLTLPHERDYFMSQALALHIAGRGLTGFLSLTSTRFSFQSYSAQNVVLFGAPVSDGRLRLMSVNRVNITGVHYEFQFGPIWEDC
jgi:hypothetical protein